MEQKKGLILCVDDEPNILRSLSWLLRKDFDVMTAPSGQEALALVRQNDFDVIVSDQRMPGMSGVEFLREVCLIAPRAMRILLTGYSDLQSVMRSVNESEVFRFINKPWHINELPKIVEEAALIAKSQPAPALVQVPVAAEHRGIGDTLETLLLIDDDPAVMDLLRQVVGPRMKIVYANNLVVAVDTLASEDVAVVIADTLVDHVDTTRLLKLMKQQYPAIVTVVFAGAVDAGDIIALINQGQIYRFIPKPIKPGFLKLVVTSAMHKHQQLSESPDYARRHIVENIAASEKETLMQEIRQMALNAAGAGSVNVGLPAGGDSLMHRMSMGFRRLFGS